MLNQQDETEKQTNNFTCNRKILDSITCWASGGGSGYGYGSWHPFTKLDITNILCNQLTTFDRSEPVKNIFQLKIRNCITGSHHYSIVAGASPYATPPVNSK